MPAFRAVRPSHHVIKPGFTPPTARLLFDDTDLPGRGITFLTNHPGGHAPERITRHLPDNTRDCGSFCFMMIPMRRFARCSQYNFVTDGKLFSEFHD